MKLRRKAPKTPGTAAHDKLFVYAELLNAGPTNVVARGELRRRTGEDGDGAAHFNEHGIIYGQLHPVSETSLRALDTSERPEFKRVHVHTSAGEAWAYEYVGDDWKSLTVIPGGKWTSPDESAEAELERQREPKVEPSDADV